jgi:AcrR family transcriptional regulator
MARLGTYAKGVARREEILVRALDVVGQSGPGATHVKDIADAVGLTPAGLLHYFDSKEELFAEILRKRDQVNVEKYWPRAAAAEDLVNLRRGYFDMITHNASVPGLVQLFMRLAADAPDPDHPAHDFFRRRGEILRGYFVRGILRLQADGELDPGLDPELLARMLQAVADGLQLQWMLEPDIDMAKGVDALFALLTPRAATS